MANTTIDLVNLDFNGLKNSLRNYLRNQEQFKDYDFEGPNMTVLLDILSYNAWNYLFYTNMLFGEYRLDTAQLLSSVISSAKELNYTPRSSRSAKAKVRVAFQATGESKPYIIPKGSLFSTVIKNESLVFSIPETLTVASANSTFEFTTDIYEGRYVSDSYIFQNTTNIQKFKLTNKNVDTRSITVVVYEDGAEIGDVYTARTSLLDLKETTKAYFIQGVGNGYYEIIFGDNIIGRQPKAGSTIVIEYRVSKGPLGNGAKQFSCDFDPTGSDELSGTPEVHLLESSFAGDDAESIDSIKYYAPRHFQVQERAVIASDYEVSLKTAFPEINAVYAYGGEEMDPPRFGRVAVSIDLKNITGIPENKKRKYREFLKKRMPFSIEPIIVEPEYSYVSVNSKVRYNTNITSLSKETLKTLIVDEVIEYRNVNLDDFNVILRYSRLARKIDDATPAIISSLTDIMLYKKINPRLATAENLVIDFGVPIIDTIPEKEKVHRATDVHALISSIFTYKGEQARLEDDGNGKVRIVKIVGNNNQTIVDIGTIDYATGIVNLNNFIVDNYVGSAIKIYVKPVDLDIVCKKNTILSIENNEINIEMEGIAA